MQDGERLLQLKFHSFSSIVDPESDTLTCWTKQKQATVEYTVDGVAQKVSLSK
jgi:hypothetical protein